MRRSEEERGEIEERERTERERERKRKGDTLVASVTFLTNRSPPLNGLTI